MSAAHFDFLPGVALQLALALEGYRHAVRAVAAAPANSDGWKASAAELSGAGALAYALPPVRSPWSQMVVRHAALIQLAFAREPSPALDRAVAALEESIEAVTQCCIEWALGPEGRALVDEAAAGAFRAWDGARREAFELARRIAALAEQSPADWIDSVLPDLHARHLEASLLAARLYEHACSALWGVGPAPTEATAVGEFESLYVQWCTAERDAATAEIELVDRQLEGLQPSEAERERVADLRKAAMYYRQVILDAGRV